MAKILILSHSPTLTTGYGRVARTLAGAFHAAGHHVSFVGIGYDGKSHRFPYALEALGPVDPEDAVASKIAAEAPDVLFTLGDPWMFEVVPQVADLCTVTWISYFALDGEPVPPEWASWVRHADCPIVFSRWAQGHVERELNVRPALIHHGVDPYLFAPGDKSAAKRFLGVPENAFVVGCVAANQQRKNLPALVRAFAAFAADKPDAWLYLHTPPQGCWDVPRLLAQAGVQHRTRLTPGLAQHDRGIPESRMILIYNAFDLFCLPTMGEGFGLPILESQSCGVPALVTDCSACTELLANPVQAVEVQSTLTMNRNLNQAVVNEAGLVARLDYFYHRRQDLELLGRQCRRFAVRFDWKLILPKFLDLIDRAPAKPKEASLRYFVV